MVGGGGLTADSRDKAEGCGVDWVADAGEKAEDGDGIEAGLEEDGAPNGLGALL